MEEKAFTEFVDFCGGYLKKTPDIVKLMRKRYNDCSDNFKHSTEFLDYVEITRAKIESDEARIFVHLRDFLSELKNHNDSKVVKHSKKRKQHASEFASDSCDSSEPSPKSCKTDSADTSDTENVTDFAVRLYNSGPENLSSKNSEKSTVNKNGVETNSKDQSKPKSNSHGNCSFSPSKKITQNSANDINSGDDCVLLLDDVRHIEKEDISKKSSEKVVHKRFKVKKQQVDIILKNVDFKKLRERRNSASSSSSVERDCVSVSSDSDNDTETSVTKETSRQNQSSIEKQSKSVIEASSVPKQTKRLKRDFENQKDKITNKLKLVKSSHENSSDDRSNKLVEISDDNTQILDISNNKGSSDSPVEILDISQSSDVLMEEGELSNLSCDLVAKCPNTSEYQENRKDQQLSDINKKRTFHCAFEKFVCKVDENKEDADDNANSPHRDKNTEKDKILKDKTADVDSQDHQSSDKERSECDKNCEKSSLQKSDPTFPADQSCSDNLKDSSSVNSCNEILPSTSSKQSDLKVDTLDSNLSDTSPRKVDTSTNKETNAKTIETNDDKCSLSPAKNEDSSRNVVELSSMQDVKSDSRDQEKILTPNSEEAAVTETTAMDVDGQGQVSLAAQDVVSTEDLASDKEIKASSSCDATDNQMCTVSSAAERIVEDSASITTEDEDSAEVEMKEDKTTPENNDNDNKPSTSVAEDNSSPNNDNTPSTSVADDKAVPDDVNKPLTSVADDKTVPDDGTKQSASVEGDGSSPNNDDKPSTSRADNKAVPNDVMKPLTSVADDKAVSDDGTKQSASVADDKATPDDGTKQSTSVADDKSIPNNDKPSSSVADDNTSAVESHIEVQVNDTDDAKPSSSAVEEGTEEVLPKKGSKKQIQRLEKLLEDIRNKIEELKSTELSLDDLGEEDSNYILEDKYQKKFVKVWNKLCELKGSMSTTGRPVEKRFNYSGTRYPEVNRKLEKFINRNKVFPDYHDVKDVIRRVNRHKKLGLRESAVDRLAREAFADIGDLLQKRRLRDLMYTSQGHLSEEYRKEDDPAQKDLQLKKKLEENRKASKGKLEEVVEKFCRKQESYKDAEEEEEESEGDNSDVEENIDVPEMDKIIAETTTVAQCSDGSLSDSSAKCVKPNQKSGCTEPSTDFPVLLGIQSAENSDLCRTTDFPVLLGLQSAPSHISNDTVNIHTVSKTSSTNVIPSRIENSSGISIEQCKSTIELSGTENEDVLLVGVDAADTMEVYFDSDEEPDQNMSIEIVDDETVDEIEEIEVLEQEEDLSGSDPITKISKANIDVSHVSEDILTTKEEGKLSSDSEVNLVLEGKECQTTHSSKDKEHSENDDKVQETKDKESKTLQNNTAHGDGDDPNDREGDGPSDSECGTLNDREVGAHSDGEEGAALSEMKKEVKPCEEKCVVSDTETSCVVIVDEDSDGESCDKFTNIKINSVKTKTPCKEDKMFDTDSESSENFDAPDLCQFESSSISSDDINIAKSDESIMQSKTSSSDSSVSFSPKKNLKPEILKSSCSSVSDRTPPHLYFKKSKPHSVGTTKPNLSGNKLSENSGANKQNLNPTSISINDDDIISIDDSDEDENEEKVTRLRGNETIENGRDDSCTSADLIPLDTDNKLDDSNDSSTDLLLTCDNDDASSTSDVLTCENDDDSDNDKHNTIDRKSKCYKVETNSSCFSSSSNDGSDCVILLDSDSDG